MSKFRYYGDIYLEQCEAFDVLNDFEKIHIGNSLGYDLINVKEAAYITGAKEEITRMIYANHGINKVYKSDPKKYSKIWSNPDRRRKIMILNGKPEAQPERQDLSMFA